MEGYLKRNETITPLDEQIKAVLSEMETLGVNDPEYPKMLTYLERLTTIKANNRRNPVSYDTVALIFGNLAGILLIIVYEQKHVLTSKGFNQIIRPK